MNTTIGHTRSKYAITHCYLNNYTCCEGYREEPRIFFFNSLSQLQYHIVSNWGHHEYGEIYDLSSEKESYDIEVTMSLFKHPESKFIIKWFDKTYKTTQESAGRIVWREYES